MSDRKQQYDMFIFLRTKKSEILNHIQASEALVKKAKSEVDKIEGFLEGLCHVVCTDCNGMGELREYDGTDGHFAKCRACNGSGMRQ